MTVERICSGEIWLARPDETAEEAARRMKSRNVGMLVVIDESRVPIGIVTDRDLAIRVVAAGHEPNQTSVEEVMTPQPKTVPLDTPIVDALDMMHFHGIRRLPVVGRDGGLAGVVTLDDILREFAGQLGQVSHLLETSVPKRRRSP